MDVIALRQREEYTRALRSRGIEERFVRDSVLDEKEKAENAGGLRLRQAEEANHLPELRVRIDFGTVLAAARGDKLIQKPD